MGMWTNRVRRESFPTQDISSGDEDDAGVVILTVPPSKRLWRLQRVCM